MANYIHHVPGRLRVNTPALKKNEARARQLKFYLEGMHGVLQAETSIVTGSVVIKYDTCLISSTTILNSLCDHGYIQDIQAAHAAVNQFTHHLHPVQKVADAFVAKLVETAVERSAIALVSALI
ncbi:HMA2 domain-containing protein [Nitrosovibrio sp. Nv4]|uniref:HMA2 domain-containing protein n=1 Tax=Nitrosovibrio sp. Nv4 TaxID=1945880 RepID=UPI000BC59174|nr:hypothetical protein [Nitrosovibrio sp. Nv4]SOD40583.1 hypothetical protein SAMN06298226_0857 [Nitrosovibrio sp. Nv4]